MDTENSSINIQMVKNLEDRIYLCNAMEESILKHDKRDLFTRIEQWLLY